MNRAFLGTFFLIRFLFAHLYLCRFPATLLLPEPDLFLPKQTGFFLIPDARGIAGYHEPESATTGPGLWIDCVVGLYCRY